MEELDVATAALQLQKQINLLTKELDVYKERLRIIANGDTKKIEVPDVGTVTIAKPSAVTQKTVTSVNYDKLQGSPELMDKLLEKGIIVQEVKNTGGGVASVTLKPNV